MIKPVGFIFIEAVLAPIFDPEELIHAELSKVNGTDENQVRKVIRNYIKPYYESFEDKSKSIIADSIKYFAFAADLPETIPLNALPTPFEFTQDIRVLCVWLLEELCIERKDFNYKDYEYTDNLTFVHRLRRTTIPGKSKI